MGRAPCCEKMGLKKGPWTPQEDQILISYIHQYGHGNWRALPKHAGLLRCGKSCRLRWTNYLRPDIKRGNFTREEEDAIINLHQTLGNRWSAIAARLPGRTDNEIKNVWHTHLKKRLCHLNSNNNISTKTQLAQPSKLPGIVHLPKKESPESAVSGPTDLHTDIRCSSGSSNNTCISTRTTTTTTTAAAESSSSPQPSCSATSSTDTLTTTALKMIRDHHHQNTTTITNCDSIQGNNNNDNLPDDLLSEDFWAEVLSTENIIINQRELPEHHHSPTSTNSMAGHDGDVVSGDEYCYYNNMDFYWYNLLTRAAETPPPPQPPHEFMEF